MRATRGSINAVDCFTYCIRACHDPALIKGRAIEGSAARAQLYANIRNSEGNVSWREAEMCRCFSVGWKVKIIKVREQKVQRLIWSNPSEETAATSEAFPIKNGSQQLQAQHPRTPRGFKVLYQLCINTWTPNCSECSLSSQIAWSGIWDQPLQLYCRFFIYWEIKVL